MGKILIACEESQAVTIEFRRLGHEAYSCDIEPCSGGHPEWHLQQDVLPLLKEKWDLMIAHPPCTYLSSSGLHWNCRTLGRATKTWEAIRFAEELWHADIPLIAIENPIGCLSTFSSLMKPSQIIQPYQFGEDASKATCLWLKGLPDLLPTKYISGKVVNGKERWGNQTDSGQNKLGPSAGRAKERSKTYQGFAHAMADKWSVLIKR
jgi:hypothetical protein